MRYFYCALSSGGDIEIIGRFSLGWRREKSIVSFFFRLEKLYHLASRSQNIRYMINERNE